MSNKKIFKKLYSKKINKNDNYQAILKHIENQNNKFIIPKKILISTCSLILIFGFILINLDPNINLYKSNEQIEDTSINHNIDITNNSNTNTTTSTFSSDYIYDINDVKKKEIDYEKLIKLSDYSFLTNLKIPSDLNTKKYKEVYVKSNKNSGYDLLKNYEFSYQNNDRNIIILVYNQYENNKNESFNNNFETLKINNIEVIINKEEKLYKSIFIYNNKYFKIETSNIDKEELINLIKSIIK